MGQLPHLLWVSLLFGIWVAVESSAEVQDHVVPSLNLGASCVIEFQADPHEQILWTVAHVSWNGYDMSG